MANYYDDQKRLIATSLSELTLYFQSLPGSVSAANVPISLPCTPLGVIRVTSSGVVPKFIYVGQPIPKNKIYPQLLPSDTLNLAPLCNGVTVANTLPAPDCGTVVCVTLYIVPPDCGTVIFISGYDAVVTIVPNSGGGWQLYGPQSSSMTIDGVVTLDIRLINPLFTSHTLFTPIQPLGNVSFNALPTNSVYLNSASHPNMPEPSALSIARNTGGDLEYDGYETSFSPAGCVIEILGLQYNINT